MKIKAVYLWENPIRPNHKPRQVERFYSFPWKSLADFQANGGNDIVTNGTYTIDGEWVKQTNWGNDRETVISARLPENRTQASIAEFYFTWYFMNASWSNGKMLSIADSWNITQNKYLYLHSSFANNSWYQEQCLGLNGTKIFSFQQNKSTWKYLFKMVIDFQNKTIQSILDWPTPMDRTDAITDTQITQIKELTYITPRRWRWYSSYNGEYVESMWYNIYF